jgi:hypothetical protein
MTHTADKINRSFCLLAIIQDNKVDTVLEECGRSGISRAPSRKSPMANR